MPASLDFLENGAAVGSGATDELRVLVDGLDDVVFTFDAEGRWTFLNAAWSRQLGRPAVEAIGRPAVRSVHPDDRRAAFASWRQLVAGGALSAYRRELRFVAADGAVRWLLVTARAQRDAAGSLRGVTGTLTDISEAKRNEAELIAARAAAEAANKSRSEFLSTMSHELRTPLNGVIGLSESLLELGAPFDPERTKRYLEIIHASGRQLLSQINAILDLARIEAGRVQVNAEPFDLGMLCVGVLESLQRDVRAKQLKTAVQGASAPTILNADERLLRQALHNLANNAVKFTPAQGRIELRLARTAAGGVTIAVADSGIGIAAEKIPLLFKPFTQVDSSAARQFGGTGLGLTIVDRIVRLHGGSVSVKTAPGEGSTFTVELPPSACMPMIPAPAYEVQSPHR